MSFLKPLRNNRGVSNLFYSLSLIFRPVTKKEFKEFVKTKNEYTSVFKIGNKQLFLDYKFYKEKFAANMTDYFLYSLYEKSEYSVSQYMTEGRRCELYDYADNKSYNHIMGNKSDFFNVFHEYMQPFCTIISSDDDRERFEEICDGQDYVIIKPNDGQRGMGVEKVFVGDIGSKNNLWNIVFNKSMIIERVLTSASEIARFHPESLNTIRVSTALSPKGKVHIMAATLRTGRGDNIVDNGHAGGVYAAIDVNSGVVSSWGFNSKGERFLAHPDTGVVFPGTKIPNWDQLMELVRKIASIESNLRYIGWDFVLNEKYQWILLEGNEPGGIDIHQQPLNRGLYYEYLTVIKG